MLFPREALRRCLALRQLSAIRRLTIKLHWNLSEVVPGSHNSFWSAIRCRLLHYCYFRKVKMSVSLCFGWLWIVIKVCWNCYVLNCHWRKCRRKTAWNCATVLWVSCETPLVVIPFICHARLSHTYKIKSSHVTNAQKLWNCKAALCFQGSHLQRWLLRALVFFFW